jgi:hypothetical protein
VLSLGCDVVSLGEWFPKFRRHHMISVDDSSTTFLHGAGKHSPNVDGHSQVDLNFQKHRYYNLKSEVPQFVPRILHSVQVESMKHHIRNFAYHIAL